MLNAFDDTLAAIHRISKGSVPVCLSLDVILIVCLGQVKVIIAPHDAHALRGSNNVPCDAYCKKLSPAFLDFYSVDECAFASRSYSIDVPTALLTCTRSRYVQDAT